MSQPCLSSPAQNRPSAEGESLATSIISIVSLTRPIEMLVISANESTQYSLDVSIHSS